ncbi:hypothetical protein C5167_024523 [Papaver somniferum]|uniref:Uncharacterized protein n=1 Tax=Papaver somniferum TaxID=3469 RepID=A0A4Y7JRW2_PAPSO|nr:cyclin-D1-1-like [Papaver somniferum]RZC62790.1 hypothetical protein C5167_024523 [Papaver somniferum]
MGLSPEHSASNLYCCEDVGDLATWDNDTWISDLNLPLDFSEEIDDDDDVEDDNNSLIDWLIDTEIHHIPLHYLQRIRDHSIDPISRQNAINWILKVHEHYHFRPVTAYLTVNYLDRFLSSYPLPDGNGWPLQLLSVACLSLAAKMEELKVPNLIDLQISEPKFVFNSSMILRMELLVMSNLKWRLRSVTPFDYLDYFVSKLPSSFGSPRNVFFTRTFSRASDLIFGTIRVTDFLSYSPSIIAAAAVILASGGGIDLSVAEDQKSVTYYDKVSKEVVRGCHQLMKEYLAADTCTLGVVESVRSESGPLQTPVSDVKHVKSQSGPPESPIGVIDAAACKSCDTHKSKSENPETSPSKPSSSKRRRLVFDT